MEKSINLQELKKVFIGEIIKTKIEERQMRVGVLADKLGCSIRHIYDMYEVKSVDVDQLVLLSHILEYDFLSHYRHNETIVDTNNIRSASDGAKKVFLAVEVDENTVNTSALSDSLLILTKNKE